HKGDIPTNFGRSYEIAAPVAKERGILLIKGAEITRNTPPGHFNAIFLNDIKPLDTNDLLECMAQADKQGAFIWWNHPDWKPQYKGWFDIHTTLYEKKYMRGIEIVNGDDYSASVHQWALDKNLTFMGNTDIHSPLLVERSTAEKHRPMTLVFAQSKTQEAVKDALENGRTAVWFENQIIGRQEYVSALFDAMVKITDIDRQSKVARFTIRNDSDLPLEMVRAGDVGPQEFTLPANAVVRMRVNTESEEKPVELLYTVKNFVIAPGRGLPVSLAVAGQLSFNIGVETSGK
ncbi:MAG: Sb-PDE family phosphodiesterase, partial [Solirubrobacterales bacterium]